MRLFQAATPRRMAGKDRGRQVVSVVQQGTAQCAREILGARCRDPDSATPDRGDLPESDPLPEHGPPWLRTGVFSTAVSLLPCWQSPRINAEMPCERALEIDELLGFDGSKEHVGVLIVAWGPALEPCVSLNSMDHAARHE